MNKPRLWLFIAVLAVVVLMTGSAFTYASTYHAGKGSAALPLCKSLDTNGDCVQVSNTEAYSPKATCTRVCHIAETGLTADFQHNYGSGEKMSTHVQGVLASASASTVYWEASQTKSYEHGVSVGRHSNQGRNEDYTNTNRAAFGDPFFTSTPGMFGKY